MILTSRREAAGLQATGGDNMTSSMSASPRKQTDSPATPLPPRPPPPPSPPPPQRVNLLTLAASAVASSIAASRPIRDLSSRPSMVGGSLTISRGQKNARLKLDGTVVTDADGASQRIIVGALKAVSTEVRIVGEESRSEMERLPPSPSSEGTLSEGTMSEGTSTEGTSDHEDDEKEVEEEESREKDSDKKETQERTRNGVRSCDPHLEIYEMLRQEILARFSSMAPSDRGTERCGSFGGGGGKSSTTTKNGCGGGEPRQQHQAPSPSPAAHITAPPAGDNDNSEKSPPSSLVEHEVDPARVAVFIDPLDGTKSYANGDYDSVTILVAIILDKCPCFGVIVKPFGHGADRTTVLESGCYAVYGGTLVGGVFVAGGGECDISVRHKAAVAQQRAGMETKGTPQRTNGGTADRSEVTLSATLPRAIISRSRAGGVVRKCIDAMWSAGLLHRDPVHVSGAGQKSLRLIVGTEGESLWFFPKKGTSLWDVAAADALLRAVGGRLSDRFGRDLDYNRSRKDAENTDGVVVSNSSALHAECIRLYTEGKWEEE